MPGELIVSAAVEGIVDEAVVRRLIIQAGAHAGTVYGRKGKQHLRQRIDGYNHASRHGSWIVLVDLDHDADCAPPVRTAWLPAPAPGMCFRIAVRAIEAWLLADAQSLAAFFGVARARVPHDPDASDDPKRDLINLVRRSRRRGIPEDIVPRQGSGRTVGPAYASKLIEYVEGRWRPAVAARRADSLRRTIACLRDLVAAAS